MSRHAAREGDGTAWLAADGAEPAGFHCYWFAGRAEDRLVDRAPRPAGIALTWIEPALLEGTESC